MGHLIHWFGGSTYLVCTKIRYLFALSTLIDLADTRINAQCTAADVLTRGLHLIPSKVPNGGVGRYQHCTCSDEELPTPRRRRHASRVPLGVPNAHNTTDAQPPDGARPVLQTGVVDG